MMLERSASPRPHLPTALVHVFAIAMGAACIVVLTYFFHFHLRGCQRHIGRSP